MCTAYEIDGANYDVDFLVADAYEAMMSENHAYQIIRYTDLAPVMMPNGKLRLMSWAFQHIPWKQTKPTKTGNTREDQLGIALWRESFRERRCVVPMTAFFEWHENPDKSKTPYRFSRPGGQVIWVAGLWREEEKRGECFSVITTDPTPEIAPVHDRLLRVLRDDEMEPYLAGELKSFTPTTVPLEWRETPNFLKGQKRAAKPAAVKNPKKPKPSPPGQGEFW
ncbi:SOS response-associated peptidase family protein [Haloferula sp. BvORR071]|uniref:SOS response-associated peptidase family protein n=1 Tax=Haloferula sp. BvORR071 TaxID=1396141 RepID=UPI000696A86C|nr:SOS response-associated peptidase family protein [Haloferula sp. BvORR071]